MATEFTEYPIVPISRRLSWPGIFSGAFLFVAIEATFGVLGAAIFNSANPASTAPPDGGIGIGPGIWMVVLSVVALYFAGKLASSQSASSTRNSGMYAGLVTFGLCIFIAYLAISSLPAAPAALPGGFLSQSTPTISGLVIHSGYWLFATLVLSMTAAAIGGIHGAKMIGLRVSERPAETKRVA